MLLGIAGPRGRPGKSGTNGTPGIPGVNAYKVQAKNGTFLSDLLIPPSIAGKLTINRMSSPGVLSFLHVHHSSGPKILIYFIFLLHLLSQIWFKYFPFEVFKCKSCVYQSCRACRTMPANYWGIIKKYLIRIYVPFK